MAPSSFRKVYMIIICHRRIIPSGQNSMIVWTGLSVDWMKQPVNALGRATTVINDALKSRVLLYAASPLFNGNTAFYANALLDPETKEPLMPQTYDANKWKKALEASEMAIKNAEAAGHELYQGEATEEMPFPADPTEYSLRMTFIDRENKEVIWGDSRKEGYYGLQNECTPMRIRHGTTILLSWKWLKCFIRKKDCRLKKILLIILNPNGSN